MDGQSREPGRRNDPRRRASVEQAKRAADELSSRRASRRPEEASGREGRSRGSSVRSARGGRGTFGDRAASREGRDGRAGREGDVGRRSRAGRSASGARAGRGGRDDRPGRVGRPSAREAAKKPFWTRRRIVVLVAVLLVMLLVGGAVAGFVWLRWHAHDDAADIQGTWYLAGTDTPITITSDRIQLADGVDYLYTLDPEDKTIDLSFGNLSGAGCYRFSLDRDGLALFDGSFTGNDTLGRDVGWTLHALVERILGKNLPPASQDEGNVTLLFRTPHTGESAKSPNGQSLAPGEGDGLLVDGADDSAAAPGNMDTPSDKIADGDGEAAADTGHGSGSDAGGAGAGTGGAGDAGASGDAASGDAADSAATGTTP